MTPASGRSWGNSVVVGTVTQVDDPEQLGRVRVSYPALGSNTEGWWARIASSGAGDGRGLLMMPLVGDEVLIAFEHDDVHRPYVIGSLWNGKGKPGDLVRKDGSFALQSDKLVVITAKDDIKLTSNKDYSLEADGKVTTKASSDMSIEGSTSISVKAGTSLTIEGGTDITLKCGGAKVSLSATGVVQVSGTQVILG
jgi:uncharacterized protein involved in type VI secretion and phage assembly